MRKAECLTTVHQFECFHVLVTGMWHLSRAEWSIFYMPEAYIIHFIWHCWFLKCSVQRPVWMGGGGAGAGWLSSFMQLSGLSKAIEFLYAPAFPPPTVWALKPPLWALHFLGLSLANICVCTRRFAGMHTYYADMHSELRKSTNFKIGAEKILILVYL